MGRVIPAFAQYFDSAGDPLIMGWLKFLESGSNNTLKNTYYDSAMLIANPNPVQLDGDGRAPNIFGLGDYRVILYSQDIDDEEAVGDQIDMFDPVTAEGTVFADSGFVFNEWSTTITYGLGDIVSSSGYYYRSLITANIGNNPATSEYAWERISFLPWWNSAISYAEGYLVEYTGGLYISLASSNLNNPPDVNAAWWVSVSDSYVGFEIKSAAYPVVLADAKKIFVLDAAVGSDITITLPTMSSAYDRFRVAFYNASPTYTLYIDPDASSIVEDGNAGPMPVYPGSLAELIYNSDLDTWLVYGSCGYALSGQIIGTAADQVFLLYADTIEVDVLNCASETNLADDVPLYFGDSDDATIVYDSAADEMQFLFGVSDILVYDASTISAAVPLDIETGTRTTTRVAPAGVFVNNSDGGANIDDTELALTTGATLAWTTVGPTGSGATYIWTALDSLPSDVAWIEVLCFCKIDNVAHAATTGFTIDVYAKKNGGIAGQGRENRIGSAGAVSDSGGYGFDRCTTCGRKIPVDSSLIFEISTILVPTPDSSMEAYIHLTGYGFNPT